MAESAGPSDYGPFNKLFGPHLLYLTLLNLPPDGAQKACSTISEIVTSEDNLADYIRLMLAEVNWRRHLVAAVAVLNLPDRTGYADPVWASFDAGSWVAPQLAVTLSFCDPDFEENAARRIFAGCPVSLRSGLSALERHSATGPGGARRRSGKNMACLIEMLTIIEAEADWLSMVRAKPTIKEVLAKDVDNSDRIARGWMIRIRENLEPLGVELNHQ